MICEFKALVSHSNRNSDDDNNNNIDNDNVCNPMDRGDLCIPRPSTNKASREQVVIYNPSLSSPNNHLDVLCTSTPPKSCRNLNTKNQ